MGMIGRLEILLAALLLSFRYRVVFFSYAFMLKDIKVSFVVNALNAVLVLLFLLALEREGVSITASLDLIEVYDARASVLGYRAILLYSVLRVCLSLCLRAKVF